MKTPVCGQIDFEIDLLKPPDILLEPAANRTTFSIFFKLMPLCNRKTGCYH